MSWFRLDPDLHPSPLVRVEVHDLDARGPAPRALRAWGLIDTGASHSAVDLEAVTQALDLRVHDHRTMVLAEHGATRLPVHEVALAFPDFDLPRRVVRVSSMRLPGPFVVLLGMDVLDGTRLELDVRGGERWLRWTLVG